jgi:acyl carrier protein
LLHIVEDVFPDFQERKVELTVGEYYKGHIPYNIGVEGVRYHIREDSARRISAMDEPQIYARLTEIFKDVFDEDSIEVTPELSAKDVDGWDSLTHIRLILTVEKVFKIKFSTSEIGKLENVGDLVTLIKARA